MADLASSKPESPSPKPESVSNRPQSASPEPQSANLALTLGHVFLPSKLEILKIGIRMNQGYVTEWKGLVEEIDIYSDSPDALCAKKFPSIKLKQTFLVWTPRAAMGNGNKGFDRGVKGPKGGIWECLEDDEGNIPIEDDQGNVVGYYLILRFREGGRDGKLTDWYMEEFCDSEGEHMVCTLVKGDKEMNDNLAKFEKACKFLTEKAVAERKFACETTSANSGVGKLSVEDKELLVEGHATATRSRSKNTAGVSGTIKQSARITDVEQPKATHGESREDERAPVTIKRRILKNFADEQKTDSTLGRVFLPSKLEILKIGIRMSQGYVTEWKGLVEEFDIYSDYPDALFAKKFPTIKLQNTFLVWTPRAAYGKGKKGMEGRKGFDRGVKGHKGDKWKAHGSLTRIEGDGIVGYCRGLTFTEGGGGGRKGNQTLWRMTEFFLKETNEDDYVMCTLAFEDDGMRENLANFKNASEFLTKNATSERNITRADSMVIKSIKPKPIKKSTKKSTGADEAISSTVFVAPDSEEASLVAPPPALQLPLGTCLKQRILQTHAGEQKGTKK